MGVLPSGSAESDLVRVGEAAEILGVHPNSVRYYGQRGDIPEHRVGRRRDRRYRRADVEAFARVRELIASARAGDPREETESVPAAPQEPALKIRHTALQHA